MRTDHPLTVAGLIRVEGGRETRVGRDRGQLADACRRGELVRVRRGWYIGADTWKSMTADERYRLVVVAAARGLRTATLSHWSAAAVWNLPMVGRRGSSVHVTHAPTGGGRTRHGVVRHGSAAAEDGIEVEGLRVTTVARTVVDLARGGGFLAGVCAADHALRESMTTSAELTREVGMLDGARGVRDARATVGFASPASESVGESLSRVRMFQLGVPTPVLQHEVHDSRGLVGRVDFWWPSLGVVGEFDGRQKYGVATGEDPRVAADRLWQEKQREDRIRSVGVGVVRWTWSDAWAGGPMVAMLRAGGVR